MQTSCSSEESWPAAARPIRAAFLTSDEGQERPNATPRFILSQDGKVILTVTGNAGWKDKMWPTIQDVTGTKAIVSGSPVIRLPRGRYGGHRMSNRRHSRSRIGPRDGVSRHDRGADRLPLRCWRATTSPACKVWRIAW